MTGRDRSRDSALTRTARRRPPLAALWLVGALAASGAVQAEVTLDDGPARDEGMTKAERKAAKRAEKEAAKRAKKERKAKKKGKKSTLEKQRSKFEASGKTASEWYRLALEQHEKGKYLNAREILLPLEDSVEAIHIQEQVKLLLGDTYFYQGGSLNLTEALARYRSFLTFFPQSERSDYAQFQVANCYFRQLGPADRDQSYTDNALTEYRRLIELFPDSPYVDEARDNMAEARALKGLASYRIAKFYWNWNNHAAAVDRLEVILREYPELPEREEALYLVAQGLYYQGERERADSYAARLAADYPDSAYLSDLTTAGLSDKVAQRQAKRQRRREKEEQRQIARQAARDRKTTRQVRRDSGLPPKVPDTPVRDGDGEPAASSGE